MGSQQEKHDVRTALAIVRGGADLLSRHESMPPERWEIACDLVMQGLERLRSIDPITLVEQAEEAAEPA